MSTLRWTYNEVMYESRLVVSLGQLVGRRALQRLQQAVLYQSHPLCDSVDNAQGRCNTMSIQTHNGGHVAVGTELCSYNTTMEERQLILEREQRVAEWRKSLPKRKRPVHEKAGPVSWIQLC